MARRTKAMIEEELSVAKSIIDEQCGIISLQEKELKFLRVHVTHKDTFLITVQRLAEAAAQLATKSRY